MKRKLLLLLLLGIGPPVWAVGTCTVSNVTSSQNANSRVPDSGTVVVALACTGDASTGSYPATTVPLTGFSPSGTSLNAYNLTGYVLYQVAQKPGGTAPTNNYTVTIKDADTYALDLGLLTSNGSSTVPQLTAITSATVVYPIVRSALTVAITGNSVASAVITLTLVFRTNGPSGSASVAASTEWANSGLQNAFSIQTSANATRLWSMTFPYNLTISKISYSVLTADNTADLYDIGFYSAAGSLVCHTGPIAGTTFAPSTNINPTGSFLSTCTLSANVRYYFAFTGNAATAALYPAGRGSMAVYAGVPSVGNVTSGGTLNGSVTPPADSWTTSGAGGNTASPLLALHN